jgi:hypothetical protein
VRRRPCKSGPLPLITFTGRGTHIQGGGHRRRVEWAVLCFSPAAIGHFARACSKGSTQLVARGLNFGQANEGIGETGLVRDVFADADGLPILFLSGGEINLLVKDRRYACPCWDRAAGRALRSHRAYRCRWYREQARSSLVTSSHRAFHRAVSCSASRERRRPNRCWSTMCCWHPRQIPGDAYRQLAAAALQRKQSSRRIARPFFAEGRIVARADSGPGNYRTVPRGSYLYQFGFSGRFSSGLDSFGGG